MDLPQRNPRVNRREFAQWMAAATALLWSPDILAQAPETAIFLRAGDPLSDPGRLHKRYGGIIKFSNDIPGNALRWRILGDKNAAAIGMAGLWPAVTSPKFLRGFVDKVSMAMAADWLSTYPPFNAEARAHVADILLQAAENGLSSPLLKVPEQTSFHNITMGELSAAIFTFTAGARMAPAHPKVAALRDRFERTIHNVLEQTELVSPDGSSPESMDYMRIACMHLVMIAEMQRTLTGADPAEKFTLFRNIGDTYLYKLLPDGTPSREGDNEYPLLAERDNVVLGYAVHRYQDRYAAFLMRSGQYGSTNWTVPVLKFLWNNPDVHEADANKAALGRSHSKHFRGVDQVVFKSGFGANDTRIEFDCGPYFAKHQHLDRNHFTIHHRGHLAIDSGADYNNTESPHYLNYYRRTVAHNTMLVFDPAEKFTWGDETVVAANDGGQRMDSFHLWNTLRSVEDWEKNRDIWDIGHLRAVDTGDPRYMYALGDATRAYSPKKLSKFTRELLYLPQQNVLLVFDDVRSTRPELRKTWLLHTVEEPVFSGAASSAADPDGATAAGDAQTVRVTHHHGEMTVHSLLPEQRNLAKRGGDGHEFWTPGNSSGGDWGSGRNWPLDPVTGEIPSDPEISALWKKMYGENFHRLLDTNRESVIPGSWRIEVSPRAGALNDLFFHVFELGEKGKTGTLNVAPIRSASLEGALCGRTAIVFLNPNAVVEFTLPDASIDMLWLRGLPPSRESSIDLGGRTVKITASDHGVAIVNGPIPNGSHVRINAS